MPGTHGLWTTSWHCFSASCEMSVTCPFWSMARLVDPQYGLVSATVTQLNGAGPVVVPSSTANPPSPASSTDIPALAARPHTATSSSSETGEASCSTSFSGRA